MSQAPRNTRERLLETALDLIWTSSYGSVSVDDICKAADVKKGSFYHYFPSKIDLAVAAMDEAFKVAQSKWDEIFSPTVPPLERFERLIDHGYEKQKEALARYGKVCGCPIMTLGSEMAPQDASIHNKTEEIVTQHKKYYESAIRDMIAEGILPAGSDVHAIANKLYAFMMGQIVMARIENSIESMNTNMKSGLRSILGVNEKTIEKV